MVIHVVEEGAVTEVLVAWKSACLFPNDRVVHDFVQANGEVWVYEAEQSNAGSGDQQVTDGECDVRFVYCNVS